MQFSIWNVGNKLNKMKNKKKQYKTIVMEDNMKKTSNRIYINLLDNSKASEPVSCIALRGRFLWFCLSKHIQSGSSVWPTAHFQPRCFLLWAGCVVRCECGKRLAAQDHQSEGKVLWPLSAGEASQDFTRNQMSQLCLSAVRNALFISSSWSLNSLKTFLLVFFLTKTCLPRLYVCIFCISWRPAITHEVWMPPRSVGDKSHCSTRSLGLFLIFMQHRKTQTDANRLVISPEVYMFG